MAGKMRHLPVGKGARFSRDMEKALKTRCREFYADTSVGSLQKT
ncbi:MAG: hypothetical protein OXE85_06765 [Roseovarius sp.]|nr:hypothetical protein [Roseovarius sp.]MCY4315673.1 hypothetical protein [Roseovarius sp.]